MRRTVSRHHGVRRRGAVWSGLLLSGMLLAGCGRNGGRAGIVVGDTEKLISEMTPDEVIVSVNGTPFRRADYDLMLSGLDTLYRANNPSANPMSLEMNRKRRARTLVREFITKEVLVQEARRRGVKATEAHWKDASRSLAKLAASKNVPVEWFAGAPEAELRLAYQIARENALILALREAEFGDRLKITEADVEWARQSMAQYNESCDQTNRIVLARGEAICKRIRSGEDFFEVAREVTEDTEVPDGVLGEQVPIEIDDKRVRKAAFSLPVGAVSDPFQTEEGLVIIKVLERKGIDSPLAREQATVNLGRILLLTAHPVAEKSDAELRREIMQTRLKKLQAPWLKALQERTRFEYPHGTNLFRKGKAG
ncbi:MAG TPA: peptidylprolyl isomerase [Kiritimatiellia bacterium]|nr:peptidylprolyl isomerase [Kiritimatiellia bacterium]